MNIERTFDLLEHLRQNHNRADVLVAKREGQWIKFSAEDYGRTSRRFSYGLMSLGFEKGDKIATISNNRPEWNMADMGMSMLGVVHVPVYPSLGEEEYKYILEHSDAKDRKSTRLNSSHVRISYAVFCLKKKKEQKKVAM